MIQEYDVVYAVKEYLLMEGWNVIAFNPPGCQGTFTIPNPAKDAEYRGQTGSISPDILAVKNQILFIIECKPSYNKKDAEKLLDLIKNKPKIGLLLRIVENVCKANEIIFNKQNVEIKLGKAHGGTPNLRPDMDTFIVTTIGDWDPSHINPKINPYDSMKVIFHGKL